MIPPPFHSKLGLVKRFVKVFERVPNLSYDAVKEGAFIRHQLRKLTRDRQMSLYDNGCGKIHSLHFLK